MAEVPSTMLPLGTAAPDFSLPSRPTAGWCRSSSTGKLPRFSSCSSVRTVRTSSTFGPASRRSSGSTRTAGSPPWPSIPTTSSAFPPTRRRGWRRRRARRATPSPICLTRTKRWRRRIRRPARRTSSSSTVTAGLPTGDSSTRAVREAEVPVTGEDLRRATAAVIDGEPVPAGQVPSVGCNIKWKPGNEPAYFG